MPDDRPVMWSELRRIVDIADRQCVRAYLHNPTRRQVLGVCRLMGGGE